MVSDAKNIFQNRADLILNSEPFDEPAVARTFSDMFVFPAGLIEKLGFKTVLKQFAHHFVCKCLHSAIGMVDDEPFAGAEQFIGDDERANRVVARPAAGISNDMSVVFGESGNFPRTQPRI